MGYVLYKIKELCIVYCKKETISQRNNMQMLQAALNDTNRHVASDPHNDKLLQYRDNRIWNCMRYMT